MALNHLYTEQQGHTCDACGRRASVTRNDRLQSLPELPDNWMRFRLAYVTDWPAYCEESIEVCAACQTVAPFNMLSKLAKYLPLARAKGSWDNWDSAEVQREVDGIDHRAKCPLCGKFHASDECQ